MSSRTAFAIAALVLGAPGVRGQVKPLTPAPIKKTVVAPTAAPKSAMPVTIATPRISFTGAGAAGLTIHTPSITFAGPIPGGAVIATSGISFVGGGVKMSSIATPAISFVGTGGGAPRTIATDPISFVGRPPR